jgi:GntR family transcriptional regulator, rspAB operon transcriptional repressor
MYDGSRQRPFGRRGAYARDGFVKFTKVKRERASDSVCNILRESILDQTFLPGQRLDVKMLAEKLDVSLTPVKDAITRLVVEGLIELRPRSGTYVSLLTPEDVEETLAIRRALECLAAETIPQNLTEHDLAWFEESIGLLERSEKDRQLHEKRNSEFHGRLVELSKNKKLIETYRSLNATIKMARIHNASNSWIDRVAEERAEHRKIVQALKTKNSRALATALNSHILRASSALVQDLKAKRPPQPRKSSR